MERGKSSVLKRGDNLTAAHFNGKLSQCNYKVLGGKSCDGRKTACPFSATCPHASASQHRPRAGFLGRHRWASAGKLPALRAIHCNRGPVKLWWPSHRKIYGAGFPNTSL